MNIGGSRQTGTGREVVATSQGHRQVNTHRLDTEEEEKVNRVMNAQQTTDGVDEKYQVLNLREDQENFHRPWTV